VPFWLCQLNQVPEAIELANNTQYGLASAVFSTNINRALHIAHSVEAGTVFVGHVEFVSLLIVLSSDG
jgi:aldehyde dehydrogenase (NAD+)